MNFKTYLIEGYGSNTGIVTPRTITITEDKAFQLLESDFSDAGDFLRERRGQPCFYRGLPARGMTYGYIDPSVRYKPSKETLNYYQYIMDTLPEWKPFPRRGRSVIGGSEQAAAKEYGIPYIVIPKNTAKFGVAPNFDIWDCFAAVGNLHPWSKAQEVIFNSCAQFSIDTNSSIEKFNDAVKRVDATHKKDADAFFNNIHIDKKIFGAERIEKYFWMNYHGNLWRYFATLFDPITNDFKLARSYEELHKIATNDFEDREIWTDSPCLLITDNKLNSLLKR